MNKIHLQTISQTFSFSTPGTLNRIYKEGEKVNKKHRKSITEGARLGRYPFAASIEHYRRIREPYCTPTTLEEDLRKLRYFGRILEELKATGRVSTTDPRHMDQGDVEAFITFIKRKGVQEATRTKYLQILDRHLQLWGNSVIQDMKNDRSLGLPREHDSKKPIKALSLEELQKIIDATYEIEGWRGDVIRGVILLSFGTGCRPKEIFNAQVGDLDLEHAQFYVRHPKGEGSWGESQWIPIIRGDVLGPLEAVLTARFSQTSLTTPESPLFVCRANGTAYTGNGIRRIKAEVERISGVSFALKDLRSSLASITVAGDVSRLKAVSLQLRHASVKNTEKYYARINTNKEIQNSLGDVWRENSLHGPKKKQ